MSETGVPGGEVWEAPTTRAGTTGDRWSEWGVGKWGRTQSCAAHPHRG